MSRRDCRSALARIHRIPGVADARVAEARTLRDEGRLVTPMTFAIERGERDFRQTAVFAGDDTVVGQGRGLTPYPGNLVL